MTAQRALLNSVFRLNLLFGLKIAPFFQGTAFFCRPFSTGICFWAALLSNYGKLVRNFSRNMEKTGERKDLLFPGKYGMMKKKKFWGRENSTPGIQAERNVVL